MVDNKRQPKKSESWKVEEFRRGKERLNQSKEEEKITCLLCHNQTFILTKGTCDFPFFDLMCSKCGSINVS